MISQKSSTINTLVEILLDRSKRQAVLLQQVDEAAAEIKALETAIYIVEKELGVTKSVLSETNSGEYSGLSILQAMIVYAEKHGGELRANEAKKALVKAGLLKNPKTAGSAIYHRIDVSGRFEWVSPGVYQLRKGSSPGISLEAMSGLFSDNGGGRSAATDNPTPPPERKPA